MNGFNEISKMISEKSENKEQGIKYDKDKPRLAEMIVDFKDPIIELCKVWTFGAGKYGKSNWKLVKNGKDRYLNAFYRHSLSIAENEYDDESHILHAAHMAFNALAYLFFVLKEKRGQNDRENM